MTKPSRQRIGCVDVVSINEWMPLAGVAALSGIRIYDVGQGDAIALLDEANRPTLQIDYGGRQGHPFATLSSEEVDARMPVCTDRLVMLSHWDEDHWSAAPKGEAARSARWLVPRQITSPRAVRFSTSLPNAYCIPESEVGQAFAFHTASGDAILWEKIAPSEVDTGRYEDCNRTGVAMAIVRGGVGNPGQAILVPGDAAFHTVPLYRGLRDLGFTLTGLVAFHHGSAEHWTRATERLLAEWPLTKGGPCEIIFSCARKNSFRHPNPERYKPLFSSNSMRSTGDARYRNETAVDLLFRT